MASIPDRQSLDWIAAMEPSERIQDEITASRNELILFWIVVEPPRVSKAWANKALEKPLGV